MTMYWFLSVIQQTKCYNVTKQNMLCRLWQDHPFGGGKVFRGLTMPPTQGQVPLPHNFLDPCLTYSDQIWQGTRTGQKWNFVGWSCHHHHHYHLELVSDVAIFTSVCQPCCSVLSTPLSCRQTARHRLMIAVWESNVPSYPRVISPATQ